ncbi:MAG: cobalamin-dependent protein [Phycisphaerales bacterium]|nr:cobalamin-dependent protein [Phycisphaerales bacterium]
MATSLNAPTSEFEKTDRCADLPHRPRVLLGKMGLDGHDRGVKVIARALRDSGVHVIYSGLWQTPRSIALSARDEDCDVIAASMMSNSHRVLGPKLLEQRAAVGRPDLPIVMGGIIPQEDIRELLESGIRRCFTTGVGLLDIVEAVKETVRPYDQTVTPGVDGKVHPTAQLARDISLAHDGQAVRSGAKRRRPMRVIGVTGSPGAGKSTLSAQLAAEFTRRSRAGDPKCAGRIAVVAFDPKSPVTSGALLGDRLRMDFNTLDEAVFYRSLAIRGEDYHALGEITELIGGAYEAGGSGSGGAAGGATEPFDTVLIETVGAGQNETLIREHVDRTVVVLTPGMGDAVQMDKAGILEIADVFVCNKADHPGQNELLRDLREVAGRRKVFETVATHAKGVPELLESLLA